MNIQWFPGHMAKTRKLINENLKLVDVVIELRDARIPLSSENPEINVLIGNKPRIIVLNKFDLADSDVLALWKSHYEKLGIKVILCNSVSGKGVYDVKKAVLELMKDKLDGYKEKGQRFKVIRTMIVGIPNVGKSSFINRIAGKAIATTGNKPGVTKSKQWIRLDKDIELLDTPGILWPKFEDEKVGYNLAFTGAIKDEILDIEELALHLIGYLQKNYSELYCKRYKIDEDITEMTPLELMELTAKKRGCIISRGDTDYHRIANIVLDEFRSAKIGEISLERP